jgi:hypothetical protein
MESRLVLRMVEEVARGMLMWYSLTMGVDLGRVGRIARRITQAKDAKSLVRLGEACIEASLGYKMFSGRYPNAWIRYERKTPH